MSSDRQDYVRISKFLSLVLRHRPDKIGISLDQAGWAKVDELISAVNKHGLTLDIQTLKEVVHTNDKQRFAFSNDFSRIRACQGHSVSVELGLKPLEPPEILYHGTSVKSVSSIRKEGLLPRGRQHVHLSMDEQTALKVGSRHGQPVVLKIEAKKMWDDGFVFIISDNGVWLTEKVPVIYIQFNCFEKPVPRNGSGVSEI